MKLCTDGRTEPLSSLESFAVVISMQSRCIFKGIPPLTDMKKSCWSLLWACIKEKWFNSQMGLSCVVTLAAFHCVRFLMYVRDTWGEKNDHPTQMISTGVQRRCRPLMMYEMRRGVHQRAERLLLHAETPSSLPLSLSLSVSLSPCLCHLPKWGSITLPSPPRIRASLLRYFLFCSFWMFIDRSVFLSSPPIRGPGVIGTFLLLIPVNINTARITDFKVTE